MAHKPANRRHGNASQSSIQRRERGLLSNGGGGMGGSVLSVTRQGGGERPCTQGGETLFVMPNGWVKSGELDPGFLPTPEHTPQQKRRGLRLSDSNSGGWDTSQTYLGGGSVGLGSPCRIPPSVYLTTRLFQQGVVGRHAGEGRVIDTPRQHYVCLSKQEKGMKGTPKAPLRKSAGEYVYPMTPQDSPERRRVVSAPSNSMEYNDPLPLRWPAQEGYILSSHGMVPVPMPPPSMPAPSVQAYVSQHHTPGLSRALLRGALERGELGELVDLSHLMSKKNCSDRTQTGQWLQRKWRGQLSMCRVLFPLFYPPSLYLLSSLYLHFRIISLSVSPSDLLCQSLAHPPPKFHPMTSLSSRLAAGSATHILTHTNWSDGLWLLLCLHCRVASPLSSYRAGAAAAAERGRREDGEERKRDREPNGGQTGCGQRWTRHLGAVFSVHINWGCRSSQVLPQEWGLLFLPLG